MTEQFIIRSSKGFEVKDEFRKTWTIRHLTKGTVIHERGSTNYKTFIILKGIARSFVYKKGREVTTYFAVDGMPILGIDAFRMPKVQSEYTIELLDDAIVAEANLDAFYLSLDERPGLCSKYVKALEQEYMNLAMTQIDARFTTAKERYKSFASRYPQIMQKVKRSYIASYLDISLETFSRGRVRWDKEELPVIG